MADTNGNEVSVTGPGVSATAKGRVATVLLIVGLAVGVVLYAIGARGQVDTKEHDAITNQLSRAADALETRNWLESIPPKDRPRLLKPFSANRYVEDDHRP